MSEQNSTASVVDQVEVAKTETATPPTNPKPKAQPKPKATSTGKTATAPAPKAKATAAPAPKPNGKKNAKAEGNGKEDGGEKSRGPSSLQLQALKVLAKAGKPMTRTEISEKLDGAFIGGKLMGHADPDKRRTTSLFGRGLVRFASPPKGEEEGGRATYYEITAAGRKLLDK